MLLLTISSDNLKTTQVALKVTADGTGDAPEAAEVTGTEKSVDAVNVTVPTGMSVTLPSVVKVNYTGSAGDYSLLKKVTWSEVKDGKAEGTIEGSKLTAQAAITESDDAATDVELAAGKQVQRHPSQDLIRIIRRICWMEMTAQAGPMLTAEVHRYCFRQTVHPERMNM